jgi:hypothetical protein
LVGWLFGWVWVGLGFGLEDGEFLFIK